MISYDLHRRCSGKVGVSDRDPADSHEGGQSVVDLFKLRNDIILDFFGRNVAKFGHARHDLESPAGQYDVEMFDENGKTIIWYQMQVDEEETVEPSEPVQPDEPEQPDQTTEPEQSDETETPKEDEDFFGKGEVEYPTESETETQPKKGNGGLIVGITVVLILLAAGAVTTIILIKKKNKKSKKESK